MLNDTLSSLSEIVNEINENQDIAAEQSLVLNRYRTLKSQYSSDIKRLTFIVEGEKIKGLESKNIPCP